ncbi:MAG: hypothetical protein ABJC26_07665 [Gemmatimonadaceae bacterium]
MADAAEDKLLTSDRFIKPTPKNSHVPSSHTSREYSYFVPLLLLAVAITSWFAFQTYQLTGERTQLAGIEANQETQVAAAGKVRVALDGLAASTQRLANGGNANAQVIVDELRKRGVTINPDAPRKP